jgi:hypothetical protein
MDTTTTRSAAAVRKALDWPRGGRPPGAGLDGDVARRIDEQVARNHEDAAWKLIESFRAGRDSDPVRMEQAFARAVDLSPSLLFQEDRIREALRHLAPAAIEAVEHEPGEGPSAAKV